MKIHSLFPVFLCAMAAISTGAVAAAENAKKTALTQCAEKVRIQFGSGKIIHMKTRKMAGGFRVWVRKLEHGSNRTEADVYCEVALVGGIRTFDASVK